MLYDRSIKISELSKVFNLEYPLLNAEDKIKRLQKYHEDIKNV